MSKKHKEVWQKLLYDDHKALKKLKKTITPEQIEEDSRQLHEMFTLYFNSVREALAKR